MNCSIYPSARALLNRSFDLSTIAIALNPLHQRSRIVYVICLISFSGDAVWREFAWGAVAGGFGEGMMHPIDTMKTRMQSQTLITGCQVCSTYIIVLFRDTLFYVFRPPRICENLWHFLIHNSFLDSLSWNFLIQ